MARLIRAVALMKRTDRYPPYISDTVRKELRYVPTVDAVEVVRCKDCKWGERTRLKQDGTDDMKYRRDYCTLYSRRHEPSYFCADGERREDETD